MVELWGWPPASSCFPLHTQSAEQLRDMTDAAGQLRVVLLQTIDGTGEPGSDLFPVGGWCLAGELEQGLDVIVKLHQEAAVLQIYILEVPPGGME